ncbi:DUF5691 domain-containing protein [Mesorhizobium sp. M0058]|uniref:DUF5691 domain-containing protein n=1 Tax=Mesorhizobium sp. M0058 TaxID=2956865 RepID=UPI00333A60F8
MNELELTGLATMRDCWITGGTAFDLAPTAWKEIAGGASPDERERRLLAIAAQALDVGLRPSAPKTLKRRPPLPRLGLPLLPERLRPLLRAALKNAADARRKARVATLVAGRGYVLHPMDWMPSASDQNSPDIYAPWIDWQASVEGLKIAPQEQLTVQNWDDFYPAARRIALTEMRRRDPATARSLMEAKAPGEPAEVRLALIELMHFGLTPEDAPFLKSLATDRSGKVQELASRLLARLGEHGRVGGGADDPVAELAAFIAEGKSGFIRRRTTYTPAKLKSPAQEKRRAELFETCNLVDLASRFGVSEPDFIAAWQFGADNNADIQISRMVAASGSDAAVTQMADTLIAEGGKPALFVLHLTPRLDSRRKRVLVRLILKDTPQYVSTLTLAEGFEANWLDWPDLTNGQSLAVLRSAVAGNDDAMKRTVDDLLETLGFLATAATAEKLIEHVVAAGMPPAAASLAFLRLNAALTGTNP